MENKKYTSNIGQNPAENKDNEKDDVLNCKSLKKNKASSNRGRTLKSDSGLHANHRERMRDRIEKVGFDMLPPHEQLEVILYAIQPRGNTNDTAQRLIKEFGSVYRISRTDADVLCEVEGVGRRTAEFLRLLPQIAGLYKRGEYEDKNDKALANENDAVSYVKTFFADKTVEHLYMFSLNQSRRIIGISHLGRGTRNSVDASVQAIVRKAVEDGASEVILVHNHPSGNCEPSHNDLVLTRSVEEALHTLKIRLWMHLIVSGDKCRSINLFDGFFDS